MSKKEAEYLNRLHDRRMILEARMERSHVLDKSEIQKELNALNWAIEFITKRIDDTFKDI